MVLVELAIAVFCGIATVGMLATSAHTASMLAQYGTQGLAAHGMNVRGSTAFSAECQKFADIGSCMVCVIRTGIGMSGCAG